MKIIHIVHGHLNRNARLYIKESVERLSSYQAQLGHLVEVWCISYRNESIVESVGEVQCFEPLKNRMFLNADLKTALNALSDNVVIHFHGGFQLDYYAIVKYLDSRIKRLFSTPYNAYSQREKRNSFFNKRIYFELFEKVFLESCKAIICTSHLEYATLQEITENTSLITIPNGLEVREVFDEIEKVGDTPVFVYRGVLEENEAGLDMLVLGFMKYRQKLNGTGILRLIGEGSYEDQVCALIEEHGLMDFISIQPDLIFEQTEELVYTSDAFFLVSRNLSYPKYALNAAAYGVPLFVSKQSGLASVVKRYKAGKLLETSSIDEIALSMKNVEHSKFSNSNDLLQMKVNSRNMIENEFNWSIVAVEVTDIYHF